MQKLEDLYNMAAQFLEREAPDWAGFAQEFELKFNAKMALYRPGIASEVLDLLDSGEIIATNSPAMMQQYFEDKIYQHPELLDDPKTPFEPVRRANSLSDQALKDLPFYSTFLQKHGIFHIMVVFALLADNSFLVLFVWRNELQRDFSDIEKLRLALFMRLIARIVSEKEVISSKAPSDVVTEFGKAYALTSSETDVLSALLNGFSLRDIARKTNRTYGTVRWHVSNLLNKCNVTSQKDLLHTLYGLIER